MKKLFILMMALLISSIGLLRADELTVYDGTIQSPYFPVFGMCADYYARSQFIMAADELQTMAGAEITQMTFYSTSAYSNVSWGAVSYKVYMTRYDGAVLSEYVSPMAATEVYRGSLSVTNGHLIVTFDTPYTYLGGNLLIGFDVVTPGTWALCYFLGQTVSGAALYGAVRNPQGTIPAYHQNYVPKTTFVYTPTGNGGVEQALAVTPSPLDLGPRPNAAWMRPFDVTVEPTTAPATITAIDVNNQYFVLEGVELPAATTFLEPYHFDIVTSEAAPSTVLGELVLISQDRAATIVPITALAYDPVTPDVWEKAFSVTNYPYIGRPSNMGALYNNYVLPGNNTDGYDAVYKLTFTQDRVLNASVIGASPKVALYNHDFNGEGGPGVDNNYIPQYGFATFFEDFESGVISEQWSNDSQYPWIISNDSYQGGYSVKSGNVNVNNTESTLALEYNVAAAAEVSFYMKYSGEGSYYDIPKFYIDGVLMTPTTGWPSGGMDWTRYEYPVTAGTHTFTWAYKKDSSVHNGSDCMWIDNISIARPATREDGSIADMMVPAGVYYLAASSVDSTFEVQIDAIIAPAPIAASDPIPADGAQGVSSPLTLRWTLGQYTTEYQLLFGTTYPPQEIAVDWTSNLAEMYVTSELLNSTQYFWQVNERNTNATTNGPVWGFTTTLTVPQMLTVADDKIFEGEVASLSWTATSRALRGYNVYQNGIKINNDLINATSYEVMGLAYNMTGYSFKVTAVYDEGESDYSNTVVVYVSGEGGINGRVFELDGVTPIANAIVNFAGRDEFDEMHTYNFTTDADGGYEGRMYSGSYTAVASADGYQDKAYDNTINIIFNEDADDIDFIMSEIYYPVERVIAAQMNDSEVKVFWSMHSPTQLVEDFESGGFISFDWDNTISSYPWEVTTNNPYEGSFCMKSSCEGQGMGNSAIQVTVDIPNDGTIKFFGKISSEENWDFGRFYIDGERKGEWSGLGLWCNREYLITAGQHTFKWEYVKDASFDDHDDCFYVDYIEFCRQPEPAVPGWKYYDTGENNGALGLANSASFYWGVMFPKALVSNYVGYSLTKVAYYDYEAHTGNILVYQGGDNAPGTLIYQQPYTANGTHQYVEWDLNTAVPVDPTQNLWILLYNNSGQHVAAGSVNTGDPNGRWVSVDGYLWQDVAAVGLDFTWNLRGYLTNRSGRSVAMSYSDEYNPMTFVNKASGGEFVVEYRDTSKVMNSDNASSLQRAFQYYNVYRTNCYDEDDIQMLASNVTDTIYMDMSWGDVDSGIYKWGVSRVYEGNGAAESEIVWSNCLDKGMWTTIDVTVTTNSQDSPEGAIVTLVNVSEPEMGYDYEVVLDATGYYAWESFRKGTYTVNIEKEGFEGYYGGEEMVIWDATSLECSLVEVIAAVENLYTSHTGWAMWEAIDIPEPQTPNEGDAFEFDFDDGMQGWTTIDADGDGYNFGLLSSMIGNNGSGHNASNDALGSQSYDIIANLILTPDNYVVSPQKYYIGDNSVLSFWACAEDDWYVAEHFGVAISTTSNTNAADFTTIQEWTMTAKGERHEGKRGSRAQGNWYEYIVDLSAYAGQEIWIALRHFNCTDWYIIDIDDVVLCNGTRNARHVESYKVMLDGVFEGNTTNTFFQHNVDNLVDGLEYTTQVQAIYSTGASEWVEYTWVYKPCHYYEGTQNGVTAEVQGIDALISWTYPGSDTVVPNPYGEEFEFNFDNGFQGWTTIDADGDGQSFVRLSNIVGMYGQGHNGSDDAIFSQSYVGHVSDHYAVSPRKYAIGSNSVFSFWINGESTSTGGSQYGVAVSTTGNTDPLDFTLVQSWTVTSKGSCYEGISDGEDRDLWIERVVDLSAYAGQDVWIALRHINSSDWYMLIIDDAALYNSRNSRVVLFDQSQIITNPGAGANGCDVAALQGGQSSFGPNVNWAYGNGNYYLLADDFTLETDATINEIEVYAYQTGSSTTSTFNGMYIQIYDGNPMNGGQVVWGDNATNVMTASAFTGIYRTSSNDLTNSQRPIMSVTASDLNIALPAGQYWLQWGLTGTLSSGPWGMPVCIAGQTITGDGLHKQDAGWVALTDGSTSDPYGVAFKISGEGGNTLPIPIDEILGAAVFRDGEFIGLTSESSYLDRNPGLGEHEYCVRMVYGGEMNGAYFSMSCAECAYINLEPSCEAPTDLMGEYVWNGSSDYGAHITWDMDVVMHDGWLYYDDGTNLDAVGLSQGGSFYWGIMLPASMLQPYAGTALTKVSCFASEVHTGTLLIYLGGSDAPSALVHQQPYAVQTTGGFVEWELTNAIPISGTQNLWIVMNNNVDGQYVASCGPDMGEANGRWLSEDGQEWVDAASLGLLATWNLRGFVTDERSGELLPIEVPALNGTSGATFAMSGVATPTKAVEDHNNRALNITQFNVYRSTSNSEYSLIATVPVVLGQNNYEYLDVAQSGTYYYQVTAYYEAGDITCESAPALAKLNPSNDYVVVNVTSVLDDNVEAKIYPNPTQGNINIEAIGMRRITIVTALGQVVYDSEVDGDYEVLNMSDYKAGIYMVRVVTEQGMTVQRVTVVR